MRLSWQSQQDDGSKTCWPVERQSRYYVTEWGRIEGGEEAMMSEIFARGPIGCGTIRIFIQFSTLKSSAVCRRLVFPSRAGR